MGCSVLCLHSLAKPAGIGGAFALPMYLSNLGLLSPEQPGAQVRPNTVLPNTPSITAGIGCDRARTRTAPLIHLRVLASWRLCVKGAPSLKRKGVSDAEAQRHTELFPGSNPE